MANLLGGDAPSVADAGRSWRSAAPSSARRGRRSPPLLKVVTRTNEAITSLLLNYVAALIVTWLVLRAVEGPDEPRPGVLPGARRPTSGFPIIWGNRVHAGIFVALVAAVIAAGRSCGTRPGASSSGSSAATPRRPAGPASPVGGLSHRRHGASAAPSPASAG